MIAICSALLVFASAPSVMIDAESTMPSWVLDIWRHDGRMLSAHYQSTMQAEVQRPVRVIGSYSQGDAINLSIVAHVDEVGAHIALSGEGWARSGVRNAQTRMIQQNLAHEFAHLWQREAYDSIFEPRWLHEGLAEALAAEALVDTGLWSEADQAAWQDSVEARCASALEQGPLIHQFRERADDADYGCGYVMISAVQQAAGLSAADLHADYAAGMSEGGLLGEVGVRLAGADVIRSLQQFVLGDYSSSSAEATFEALRAGRL